MLMYSLLAAILLPQAEGPAVAALPRRLLPPPVPAPAPLLEDWREFILPRLSELPATLEPGDVETVPLDLRVENLGLFRLQEIREEPTVYPTISRVLFGGPAFLLEGLAAVTMPDHLTIGDQRVFDRGSGGEDLAWIFGRTLLKREIGFLGGLESSELVTTGVESGQEAPDKHRFDRQQQRVVLDSLKRAYRERYHIPGMDFDTALSALSSGSAIDYVLIPGLASAYTAKFGMDRKFHLGEDVEVQLSIEKGMRFYKVATQDHGGRLAAFSVNLFKLPVSAIVSLDSLENGIGFGFVGIGTDLHAVFETVNGARGRAGADQR